MSGLLEVCRDRTRGRPMSYQLTHTQLAHNLTALGEDFRREIWAVRLCDLGSLPNSHVTQRSWAPVPLPDQHLWWWQRQGANLTGDLLHYWALLTAGNFCGASHETGQFFSEVPTHIWIVYIVSMPFPHKTQVFCSILLKNIFQGTDEMAQWVRVIASKSKEVSSVSGPSWWKESNVLQIVLWPLHESMDMPPHSYNKYKIFIVLKVINISKSVLL